MHLPSRIPNRSTRFRSLSFCLAMLCSFPASLQAAGQQTSAVVATTDTQNLLGTVQLLNGSLSTPARRSGMHAALATSERLLLQQRAALLRQLVAEHPEQVRAAMLPPGVVAALTVSDPQAAPLLEREVSATGELTRQISDDFDHGTHRELLQLHVTDETGADLHVFATAPSAGMHLQHHRVQVTGIALGDSLAAETMAPAVPAPTSSLIRTGTKEHAQLAAAAGSPLSCAPTGEQKTAVLMLQFPGNSPSFSSTYAASSYWQAAMTGPRLSVNDFWTTLSSGRTSAAADIYNPIQMPQSYSCQDYLSLRTAALQAAQASVDLSKYTRIVLAFPVGDCSYGGLADVGCNAADTLVNHPYSIVWLPVLTRYGPDVAMWGGLAHELGHNLGLNHANSLDFGSQPLGPLDFQSTNPGTVTGSGATSAAGSITAVDTEYGDPFSTMAVPWTGGAYSADHRAHLLGWIPSSGTDAGARTVLDAGRYTLQPAEDGSGLRTLRILRDAVSSSWLWVEYHQPDNGYTSANLALVPHQNAAAGATVHYENGYGDPDKTWQLNMARSPASSGTSFADAALLPGAAWSDPYSPLTISVESATTAGLTVNVGYDTPCATFAAPPDAVPATGGSGTVAVQAPAGCAWTASTNATWLTLTGATGATGNGSFTWTAAANSGSAQRVTYLTVGRQSSRLLQVGTGASVVSLLPQNGSAAPGASTVFTLNVSGGLGAAEVGEVELDISGAGTDPCTVLINSAAGAPVFYLYDRTNDAYTAGVIAGSSGVLSFPGCTFSAARSGLAVTGSALQYTLDLAFPADQPGVRSFFAAVGTADALPVGLFDAGRTLPENPLPPPPPAAAVTSSLALTANPSAALSGTPVTLAATVTGLGSRLIPGGSVRFQQGSTVLGVSTLDGNAHATLILSQADVGVHTVVAIYSGDAVFPASLSAPQSFTIARRTPLMSVSTSLTKALAGLPIVVTVSVSIPSDNPLASPTGTVLLKDGTDIVGSVTLSASASGIAAGNLALPSLAAGIHTFTATYAGDAANTAAAAVSAPVQVMDFAVSAPGTPLVIPSGAMVHNTTTIHLTPGQDGFLANVTFTCSGAPAHSTCSVRPGPVMPGSTAVPVTVLVQTTAASTASPMALRHGSLDQNVNTRNAVTCALPFTALLAWTLRRRRGLESVARLLSLLAIATIATALNGCGSGGRLIDAAAPPPSGNGAPGTPTGTYVLTVTGTASAAGSTLTHTASLQVNVR